MSLEIESDVVFRNFYKNEEKVAIFDLDFTLIRPKTWGGKFLRSVSYLDDFPMILSVISSSGNFFPALFEFSYAS